ncbi:MAG TPA: hypothetical protein VHE30_00760 [Polyangiaceae bacterium]|nr:hypothetical protein [Polyangiaceae bacterium]
MTMALIGCPFCRELFTEGEADHCPVCGVPLKPVDRLPASYEERVALAAELAAIAPEDRQVPFWYWRRGRGALVALAVLGLFAFFLPWVTLHKPDEITYTGLTLARVRGGWFFGAAAAWLVTIPLVVTRRTVYKMRGVRIITATFAAMSVVETAQLLLLPPRGGHLLPVDYDWGIGLWASLGIGVLGVLVAARLGGSIEDIDVREFIAEKDLAPLSPDESDERTLH